MLPTNNISLPFLYQKSNISIREGNVLGIAIKLDKIFFHLDPNYRPLINMRGYVLGIPKGLDKILLIVLILL